MQFAKTSFVILFSAPLTSAFAPSRTVSAGITRSSTPLKATIDPETVTKKEYQDICGIGFDDETLEQRLERTSYLYPKHVEVVEDLSPLVDRMVDDIVSFLPFTVCFQTAVKERLCNILMQEIQYLSLNVLNRVSAFVKAFISNFIHTDQYTSHFYFLHTLNAIFTGIFN